MEKDLEEVLNELSEVNESSIENVINNLEYLDYNEFVHKLYTVYRFIVSINRYEIMDIIVNKIYDLIDKIYDKEALAKGYSMIISFSTLNDLPEKAVEYGLKFEEIKNDLKADSPFFVPVYSSLSAVFFRNDFNKEAIEYTEKMFRAPAFEFYPLAVRASQYINYMAMEEHVTDLEFFNEIKTKLFEIFNNNDSEDIKSLYKIHELNMIQLRNDKAIKNDDKDEMIKVMNDFEKYCDYKHNGISSLVQQQDTFIDVLKTFYRFGKYQFVIEKCKYLISISDGKGNDNDIMETYKLLIASLEKIAGEASIKTVKEYNSVLNKYYEKQIKLKKQMIEKSIDLYNLEKKIKNIVRIDPLTNCYNRRYLDEFMENNDVKAVIYLDIDQFKKINDKFGHKNGDILLASFVEAINCYLPKDSALFRMGGDEFVILSAIESFEENDIIMGLAKKKLFELSKDQMYGDKIDFSYGIYLKDDERPCTLYEMIDFADELMYMNKATHKKKK